MKRTYVVTTEDDEAGTLSSAVLQRILDEYLWLNRAENTQVPRVDVQYQGRSE